MSYRISLEEVGPSSHVLLYRRSPSTSDVFVMHVRAQNAAVIVRMLSDQVRFEIFEVSPKASAVTSTSGRLLCSYPGPAVQIPSHILSNKSFLRELASFLIQMDVDVLDSLATAVEAEPTEAHEGTHPRYISELLVGILRGFGQPASVDRITKRIGDEALCNVNDIKPWRRSPLWLVIRVALQTSLERDRDVYKQFILFFHARLLQVCIEKDFSSESLYLMRVKMARRLSKLGPTVSDYVYQIVYDAAKETEALLQNRWSTFQEEQSVAPPWHPEELDLVRDTAISLNNSRRHLMKALDSTPRIDYARKSFKPSHPLRLIDTIDFGCFSDGKLTATVENGECIALADFELSVERHLDAWVDSFQHKDNAPDVIASCIEQYYDSARKIYSAYPEDSSVMVLTIMDLWKALDILTIRQCPLLAYYSPEIPREFLHPLLLHRSRSLQRATLIEEYILHRHEEAFYTTSLFSNNVTETSFAVRYFHDSPKLQQLYADINQRAAQEQEQKRFEVSVMNKKWQSLKDATVGMDHTCVRGDKGKQTHGRCNNCRIDNKANKLKIGVFEWPLPQETLQARWVMFELSPPRAFCTWREITYKILCDIGKPKNTLNRDPADQPDVAIDTSDESKPLALDTFSALKRWAIRHNYHRITIGSITTPFCDQRQEVHIPADEYKVLLNNGLAFKFYDRNAKSWATQPVFLGSTISAFCTSPVPVSSPYNKIHSFVVGTQHTTNEAIAAQANCPPELSLHEHMAFSGLRSGPRLQWLNIARELSSPSLSFRREGVHALITQAAWHLGPLSDGVREWHADLGIPSFGRTLLHELEFLLERIEANWLEEVAIRTIGMLGSSLHCNPVP